MTGTTAETILDPAARVADPEFVRQAQARYLSKFTGEPRFLHDDPRTLDDPSVVVLDQDSWDYVYGNMCDVSVQLLWPEAYGTDLADPMGHTSAPARALAEILMAAAGFVTADPDEDDELWPEEVWLETVAANPGKSVAWVEAHLMRERHRVLNGDMSTAPEYPDE